MPSKLDKIPINNELLDRRVKLTHDQKVEIRLLVADHSTRVKLGLLGVAISQRILARRYGVSRRTIQFVLMPHMLVENIKRREERGGSKQYHDTDKRREYMRNHRAYKKELHLAGKLEI